MTLNLLLSPDRWTTQRLILAHPSAASVEALLSGLGPHFAVTERVFLPLPFETTRRRVTPPPLMRSMHLDLWNALSVDERGRTALVAGPTAAFLAPAMGDEATTMVAVPDPDTPIPSGTSVWRFALGPFPELDAVPEEEPEDRDRWEEMIRAAIGRLDLVRAGDTPSIAREIAAELGLGPRAVRRVAAAAAAAEGMPREETRREKSGQWINEILYSLSRAPVDEDLPGGGDDVTVQGSAAKGKRRRKRARRRRADPPA